MTTIQNLKLPLQYLNGAVCDADGKTIVEANRDANTTPLRPFERDEILQQIVIFFNKSVKPEKVDEAAIERFALALKSANKAAIEADKGIENDGGTCNFDTPILDFKGWKEIEIQKLSQLSGIRIGDKMTSKFWKGCRMIYVQMNGQGANRTRMAEAAFKSLQEAALPASMYYQMD